MPNKYTKPATFLHLGWVVLLVLGLSFQTFATRYYVSNSLGSNANTVLQAQNPVTPWQTLAFAISTALSDDTLVVLPGAYNETNLIINKRLKIFGNETAGRVGEGVKPVFSGNSSLPQGSVFIVQSTDVVIRNFEIHVNQSDVIRGIFAAAGGFNRLEITDNHILSTSNFGFSIFNSFGIMLGQPSTPAGVDSVVILRNQIRPMAAGNSRFGRGIRLVGGFGRIGGPTLEDSNSIQGDYGIQWGDAKRRVQILNNHIWGTSAAIELNIPAANQTHLIRSNILQPAPGLNSLTLIELKNNTLANSNIRIEENQLLGFPINGIFSTRSRNVFVEDNQFQPADTARNFVCIAVNTKQQTTASEAPTQSGISITRNSFGANTNPGGTGIWFQNHHAGLNEPFANVVIGGTSSDANTFAFRLQRFIVLDTASGNSKRLPIWNQAGYKETQMEPVRLNLNVSKNLFGTSSGEKTPGDMDLSELLTLENKLVHAIDFDSLGFISVIPNQAFVTNSSFISPKTTSPSVNRALKVLDSDDWTIVAEGGNYPEAVDINLHSVNVDSDGGNVQLDGLSLNSPGKVLTLNTNLEVIGNLSLNQGKILLTNKDLFLNSTASVLGGSVNSYVETSGQGKFVHRSLTSSKTFPIGTDAFYFPVSLSNSGVSDDYGMRVNNDVLSNGFSGSPVDSVVAATWVLSEGNAGGSNLSVSARWSAANEKPFFQRNATFLQGFSGSWVNLNSSAVAATGSDPFSATYSNLTSSFSNTPLRIRTQGAITISSRLYYVDDASGDDTRSNDDAKNPTTPWKTIRKALESVDHGDSIQVFAGNYAEANLAITKRITLLGNVIGVGSGPGAGTGVKPIVNGTSLLPSGSIFIIQSTDVVLKNFDIRVDQLSVIRGIFSNGGGFNRLRIEDNLIQSTNTLVPSVFNSFGIQLGTPNINAGLDSVVMVRNTIKPLTSGSALFGRGVRLNGGFGRIGSELLADSNYIVGDYGVQWGGARRKVQVLNNSLKGRSAALELNVPAANQQHLVKGNTFRPSPGQIPALTLVEIKNNTQNNAILELSENKLIGHPIYGIFSTRSRNVRILNNQFEPSDTARFYSHIVANTKQQTTGNDAVTSSGFVATGNTFKGNATGKGSGILLQNHHAGALPPFVNVQIGGAGALANRFEAGIGIFVGLDSSSGSSLRLPLWNQAGYQVTSMLPVATDLDLSQNAFDVGSGEKLPAAMSLAELLQLEDRLNHGIDFDSLGFLTVIPTEAFVTQQSFMAPKTSSPSLQRAHTKASDGWLIHAQPGVYPETLSVSKTLDLNHEPNDPVQLNGIAMNEASKVLTLRDPVVLQNNLTLTDGTVRLNTADLRMNATATLTGGSQQSYVQTTGTGKLVREGVANLQVGYPIGTPTSFFPVRISNSGTSDAIGVRVQNDVLSQGLNGTPVDSVVGATWVMHEDVAGGSSLAVIPQWNEANEKPFFNRSAVALQGFFSSWQNISGNTAVASTGSDPYEAAFSPVTATLNNLPVRVANFKAEPEGNIYYVDDNTGDDIRTNLEARNPNTPWRTIAKALASVSNGDSIQVFDGIYNESNLNINKAVKLFGNVVGVGTGVGAGTGIKPIVNGTAGGADSSIFTVRSADVLIKNFQIEVDQALIINGILAKTSNYNRVQILNNRILSVGVNPGPSFIPCMRFNTYGIRLVGFGTDSLLIAGNEIQPSDLNGTRCVFGRGIKLFGGHGRIGGDDADSNTVFAYYDIQSGDADGGRMLIDNNFLVGIGVQFVAPAANTGQHLIRRNIIGVPPQFGGLFASMVELKDIQKAGLEVLVSENIIGGYANAAIFSQRSKNVKVWNNIFLPGDTASNYRHIVVNTKQETVASVQNPVLSGISIKGNQFNGNPKPNAGTAIEFGNHNDDPNSNLAFENVEIGGPGAEANTFASQIGKFVVLDPLSGPSNAVAFWSNYPVSTMAPVKDNFDIQENLFGVSGGSKRPASMSDAEYYELEDKVVHGIDYDSLGFVTWKPTYTFVTNQSFLQPYTGTPSLQRAVNIASGDGWQVNIQPLQINENVTVSKSITWNTFPADSTQLNGISMNGLGKVLTLSDKFIVSQNLTLNNPNGGKIDVGNNDLVALANANVSQGSLFSYVISNGIGGLVRRGVTDASTDFPVGTIDSYAPVNFDDENNTGDEFKVTVQAAPTVASFTPPLPGTINTFVKFQWNICEKIAGGSIAKLAFDWTDPANVEGSDQINGIARNDGTNWNSVLANIGPGLVASASGFADFCSPFALVGDPNLTSITTQNPIRIIGSQLPGACVGDSIKIPFQVSGTGIVSGNTFNAFLSDPDGTFPSNGGVLIGSLLGTLSDTIIGVIPTATATGSSYRIRVVSTNVAITGVANPTPISIFALPARPTISGDSIFCQGQSAVLTSSVANAYFWIPGGQNTQAITVTASGPVRVRIIDENGCRNTSAVRNVLFSASPVAEPITASGPLVACAGDSITLTANPAGLNYTWIPTSPSVTTRNFVVKNSGSYQVILSNGAGCADTSASVTVVFNPLPAKPTISSPAAVVCQPGTLELQTVAGFTYDWTITNVSPNPTTQNVSINTPGAYTATVTISDANNCKNTSDPFNGELKKAPNAPQIVSVNGDLSVCEGTTVTLQPSPSSTANTYTWNPGAVVGPTFTLTNPGVTSVSLAVDSNGCTTTVPGSVTVTINPRPETPVATISVGTDSFCQGGSATLTSSAGTAYLWSPGAQTTQSIEVSTSGSFSVVTVSDSGCQSLTSNVIAITVRPNPTKPTISASRTSFCFGDNADLNVVNPLANTYIWSNGFIGTSITVNVGGNYAVRVDSSNGCFANSDTLIIIRNPLPEPVISAVNDDFRVCLGDTVVLSSNYPGAINRWNTNPPTFAPTIKVFRSQSSIILEVTDANGCKNNSLPVDVIVDPLPTVTLQKDSALVLGEDFDLVAANIPANAQTFNWRREGNLIGSTNVPNFSEKPQQTAYYSVEVVDVNGCRISDTVLVRVSRELFVPNMFSPNGDKNNDRFKVYGFGVASIEVKIYDRLGNLVYETNKVEDIVETTQNEDTVPGWDGKYKGKELSNESFIWSVKGKFTTGEDLRVRGGKNSGSVIIMN